MQCRKYGVVCPGYQRLLQFQDEGPRLQARFQKKRPVGSGSHAKTDPDVVKPNGSKRNHVLTTISIDERVHPTLVRQSFVNQQPQVFKDFICAAFPTMFYHNAFRFGDGFTFPDWVVKHFGSKHYYDAAVSCLSAEYLGHLTKDPRFHHFSRQKYSQALRAVRQALDSEEASSDTMLLAAILLSFYEMNIRTTRDAWVCHSRAVKQLMLKRGTECYLSGTGRVCHFAYRPFLIAAALYEGKPCFLNEDKWQNLAETLRVEDSQKHSEWSFYINVYETIFMELVKCPGHIQEAREIDSLGSPRAELLAQRIRVTCDRLRVLSDELRSMLASDSQRKQGIIVRSFVGPEPNVFPETSPSFILGAAVNTITILEKLVTRLSAPTYFDNQSPSSSRGTSSSSSTPQSASQSDGSCSSLDFRFTCELGGGIKPDEPRPFTWLDRVAGSMGLLGAEIIYEDAIEAR